MKQIVFDNYQTCPVPLSKTVAKHNQFYAYQILTKNVLVLEENHVLMLIVVLPCLQRMCVHLVLHLAVVFNFINVRCKCHFLFEKIQRQTKTKPSVVFTQFNQ